MNNQLEKKLQAIFPFYFNSVGANMIVYKNALTSPRIFTISR